MLSFGEQTKAVLDDDHRAVDDDAEVDRAEAHEIGAHLRFHHASDGHRHGKRNDAGRDESRTDVAKDKEEHDDHQDRAFDEVFLDGLDRRLDEIGAVVNGAGNDAFRKRLGDVAQLGCHPLCHRTAVLADQQHGRSENCFLPVQGSGAGAEVFSLGNVRYVLDPNRNTAARADDDVLNFRNVGHLARRADEVLLAIALDVAGADIGVVGRNCGHQIAESEPVSHQLPGVRQNVELALKTADGVDFDHAGNVAKLRLDDPVLNGPQFARRIAVAVRALRPVLRLDRVHVDFAKPRGDRAHGDLDAGRKLILDLLDAFVDELTREIDVRPVQENDRDLAQAISRQGARIVEFGKTAHRCLDRKGDALFSLQRRVARRLHVDLHLDVGDVRYRVDRQPREIPPAESRQPERDQQD